MSDYTISPNMSLIVPTVSSEPGPTWASDINASLSIIDQHNHSPGSGVQISQDGIFLSSGSAPFNSLNYNNSNAYGLRSVKFTAQSAALALVTDIGCIYEAGVDLYYNDGSGNQIRITQGGSLTGAAGTITGLPSGTASASYSGGTFVWQSATSTAANMDAGSYILRNATASSKGLTLSPPNAMAADFALVLPSIPGSTSIMQLDSSGNMSAALVVDNSTLQNSGTVLSVKSGGITGTQMVSSVDLPGNIVRENGKNVVVSAYNSITSLSVLVGQVSTASTSPIQGGGYSVTLNGTGDVTITYTNPFSSFAIATATIVGNYASQATVQNVNGTSTVSVRFKCIDGGVPTNSIFEFIVIGPR